MSDEGLTTDRDKRAREERRHLEALLEQEREHAAEVAAAYERGKAEAQAERLEWAGTVDRLSQERDDAQVDFIARLGAQASLHQGELQKIRERNRALREALQRAFNTLEADGHDAEYAEELLAQEEP